MAELITIDGLNLSGVDHYGDWKVSRLEGWWDTPERKSNDTDNPVADGGYDVPEFYEQRLITIEGRVRTSSHDAQHEAMILLSGALSRGTGQMVVAGHGPDQWARVKLAGSTRFTIVTDRLVQFQIRVKAPDPRKYGDTNTFVTPQDAYRTVFHYGNYQAIPVFTIQGVMPGGYRIYGPAGEVFTVTAALNGTDVIDFADGTVTRNGTTVLQGAVGQWGVWTVGPGANSSFMVQPVTTGTATITAKVKDTFI